MSGVAGALPATQNAFIIQKKKNLIITHRHLLQQLLRQRSPRVADEVQEHVHRSWLQARLEDKLHQLIIHPAGVRVALLQDVAHCTGSGHCGEELLAQRGVAQSGLDEGDEGSLEPRLLADVEHAHRDVEEEEGADEGGVEDRCLEANNAWRDARDRGRWWGRM